jgi:GTP-binding protein
VVGLSGARSYVIADIPGIIEGAHAGKGLGLQFLRHVERTRLLAFLVPLDAEDPQAVYDRLRTEIGRYSELLAARPHLVVLTKRDLLHADAVVPAIVAPKALSQHVISSAANIGLEELKEELWRLIRVERQSEEVTSDVT